MSTNLRTNKEIEILKNNFDCLISSINQLDPNHITR